MLQPTIPFQADFPKITMHMRTPRVNFREVHYFGSPGTAGAAAAYLVAAQLQTRRFNLLAANCFLDNTEVVLSQTKRYTLPNTGYAGVTVSAGVPALSNDNDCIRLFCRSGAQYRKSVYLGGIPDFALADDKVQPLLEAAFFANVQTYCNQLIALGLGFLAVGRGTAYPRVKITSLVNSGGLGLGTFTVTTLTPHLIAPENNPFPIVRISGVNGTTSQFPFNQMFPVTVTGANTFTINQVFNATAVIQFGGGGFAHEEVKVFTPYTTAVFSQIPDTRNRGVRGNPIRGSRKFKRTIGY